MRISWALIGLFLLMPVERGQAQDWRACRLAVQDWGEVQDVNRNGELILHDGRLITLAGLVPVHLLSDREAKSQELQKVLLVWLKGQTIGLSIREPKPDRWGRIRAQANLALGDPEQEPISLTLALVDAGLGLVQPEDSAGPCLVALYRAEAQARSQRLGFWTDQEFRALAASDLQRLRQKAGEWALVEGKIISINESKFRTYLNLGPRRGSDLSVVIANPHLKSFQQRGMMPTSLLGKRLLIHGLVDWRFGPQIEISGPDAIEVLDEKCRLINDACARAR